MNDRIRDVRLTANDPRYRWLMAVLTVIYTVFTLLNLGTTSFPRTVWRAEIDDPVVIDLGTETDVATIWFNGNIAVGHLTILADDGTWYTYDQQYGEMFSWKQKTAALRTQSLRLQLTAGEVALNEIAFLDGQGNRLSVASVSENGRALVDEQDTVPEKADYFNGMYFDEIYHARTAYEIIHGMSIYEWTHPPLGKELIAVGILAFGMTPFGWRVVPALFGAAMLPLFYALGRRLFRRRDLAFLAAALFAVDTMHYSQTRIATVDVFIVFFILLMVLFMAEYLRRDDQNEPLSRVWLPLGACGVSFGLGVAAKWTGLYAGVGLAVVFFAHLIRRGFSARAKEETVVFFTRTWKTILFCLVFFVGIPALIYFLAYIPFYRYEFTAGHYTAAAVSSGLDRFRAMIRILAEQQKSMFAYHSGLTATHLCQSAWYEWPFAARSVWFYFGSIGSDRVSSISTFGNPAVWWVSAAGALCLLTEGIFGRLRKEGREFRLTAWLLLITICANYLPWALVPRCTFQYHYFPTIPFVILAAVLLVQHLEERGELPRWCKWGWLGLAAGYFLLLLPAASGIPMTRTYARFLEYILPTGVLFHGAV